MTEDTHVVINIAYLLVQIVFLIVDWLVCGVLRHFQQYFSYFVEVSFIGGGNRSTRRKPQSCCKSLTNFIT